MSETVVPESVAVKVGITGLPDASLCRILEKQLELVPQLQLQACLSLINGLVVSPDNHTSDGIDTAALALARPDLPIETAGALADPAQLAHFLMLVHAHAAWQALHAAGLSRSALVNFHSRYKYQLMACSPRAYRELGRRLGQSADQPLQPFANDYFHALMEALRTPPTPGLHCNVLMHLSGYFSRSLDATQRQRLEHSILAYRHGAASLAEPLGLLRQHLREHPNPYLSRQVYLQPYLDGL